MTGTLYRHLSDANEIITLESGKTIAENLPDINFENAFILVNGKKAGTETIINESDIVMIRFLPADPVTAVLVIVGVVAAVIGVGVGHQMYMKQKRLDAELEKMKKGLNNDKIDNRPFIRGASNAIANGKSQPYICGRHLFTPYLSSYPFYKIIGGDGLDQYYYAILECGFNKQILEQIKVDDVVIKNFTDSAPQQGTFDFNSDSIFYSPESKIEIIQNGGAFTTIPELNVKTVAETANKQIPYADQIADGSKTHLQFTLAQNSKSADVVITFNNGLFAYNDDNDKVSTAIDIIPEYSLTGGKNESDWTPFFFDQNGTKSNTFNRNVQKEIRFTAHVDFTAAQVADRTEPVLIRVRTPASKDSKKTNACYVMYVQSTCFDAAVWTEKKQFVDCKIIEDRERAFCTMLGIRIKATDANEDKLNKINVITHGIARTWDGSKWSVGKTATRNPAAILLEVLTSDSHPASRFDDDEIDLPSFGDLYEYSEANGYHYDKVITDGVTKQDTINQILAACDSVMYKNIIGKYAIATDTKKTNAISVFNSQNIISIENKKEFKRRTDGIRVKFVNSSAGYAEDSYLVMRAGVSLTQDSVLRELTVDGITEYEHVVKYARRIMASESLRPKATTIQIGHEGVFFTPFAKILLQDDSLKIGLSNGTIQSVREDNGYITGLTLYDAVEFVVGSRYGMIINCVNEQTAAIISVKVTGDGFTKQITLDSRIPIPQPDQPQAIPGAGDTFAFGLLNDEGGFDKITSPFLITGMSKTDDGYSLELVDYNEAVYDTGDIPEYKSNITERPPENKGEILPDYATKDDLFDMVGTDKGTDNPDVITGVKAKSQRDQIKISWNPAGFGNKNRVQKYLVQISVGEKTEEYNTQNIDYTYVFDRKTDGYPEKSDLLAYKIRVCCVNMFGKAGDWSAPVQIDASEYGTWQLQPPILTPLVSRRVISLSINQPPRSDGASVYGTIINEVQIRKPEIDAENEWFKPATAADPYAAEENYKDGTGHVSTQTTYIQSVPLKGQNNKSADGTPLPQPEDTLYQLRVKSKNEINETDYTVINVIAKADSLQDMVDRIITGNKIAEGTILGENIHGTTITAEKMAVEVLSAITANLGYITGGVFEGTELNRWALTTTKLDDGTMRYEGAMRVGGVNQYLEVIPVKILGEIPSDYEIKFKVGNFEITSTASNINGVLHIQKNDTSLDRTRITPTGTFYEHRNATDQQWDVIAKQETRGLLSPLMYSETSITLTNASVTKRRRLGHDIGRPYISASNKVYHFDTDLLDQSGASILSIADAGQSPSLVDETNNSDESVIDFTPAILSVSPFSEVGRSLYGQYSLSFPLGNSQTWTVDCWIQYIWAENQTILDIGTPDDRILIIISSGEPNYNEPEENEPPYNEETLEADKLVYNEAEGAENYIIHQGVSQFDVRTFKDEGIIFDKNSWIHIAVVLTASTISLFIGTNRIDFQRYSTAAASQAQAVFNAEKNSFIIDELSFDTATAEKFADFTASTKNKIPFASLDYRSEWFILDAGDPEKVKTNLFSSTAFRQAVQAIIQGA